MARYYLAVLILNVVFTLLFYTKMKQSGLSLRSFILMLVFSLFCGIAFPVMAGHFRITLVLGINLVIISIGAFFINYLDIIRE